MATLLYTLLVISVLVAAVVCNLHFKEWVVATIIKFSTVDVQTFDAYPKNKQSSAPPKKKKGVNAQV